MITSMILPLDILTIRLNDSHFVLWEYFYPGEILEIIVHGYNRDEWESGLRRLESYLDERHLIWCDSDYREYVLLLLCEFVETVMEQLYSELKYACSILKITANGSILDYRLLDLTGGLFIRYSYGEPRIRTY